MVAFQLPSVKHLAVTSIACYTVYRILASLLNSRRRRALIRRNGCQPPFVYRPESKFWGLDTFLGLNVGNYQYVMKLVRESSLCPTRHREFESMLPAKTFEMKIMHVQWTYTNDVENVKHVMATDFANWVMAPGREFGLGQLLGRGIFTTDGAAWQHSRDLLKPNFTRFHVSNMALFERHLQPLIAMLPKDRSTVDLSPLFFGFTMDVSTEFLFGHSTESLVNGGFSTFSDAWARGQAHSIWLFRMSKMAKYIPYTKQFAEDRKTIYELVDKYVYMALEEHKKGGVVKDKESNTGKYVLLEELVSQTDDPVQLRSELLAILLAGRDTTASTMTNIWFILAQRPDLWERLQAEVATLNGQHPTFEKLKELKFLQAFMNETLRLYPPVPLNSRVPLQDSVIPRGGGPDGSQPLIVPKGQIVSWNLYSYHRQKDIWGADAEEFNPDRWMGKDAMRQGWHYLAFNAGPRICLGQQFALTQMGYVTVRLCQTFSGVEIRGDDKEWRETIGVVLTNKNGAKVALTPRE